MTTYEVRVDQGRCLGYASCVGIAPDIFLLPPESPVAVVIAENVGDDRLEDVQEAVRNCAARAISVHPIN